jgi:hypothetical protein
MSSSGQVKFGFLSAQGGEKVVEIVARASFGEAIMLIDKPYVVGPDAVRHAAAAHRQRVILRLDADRTSASCWPMAMHPQAAERCRGLFPHSGSQRVIGYLLREMAAPGRGDRCRVRAGYQQGG